MIIAIDFDGTIVEDQFPEIGPLQPNCKEVISRLKDKGHTLILWTCRENGDKKYGRNFLQEALVFLKLNGIDISYINENVDKIKFNPRKIYADKYIDDKGLVKIDWLEIEKQIDNGGY